MANLIHKDYCSKCKQKNIPLLKYNKSGNIQYYYCRKCQNERQKSYYATPAGKKALEKSRAKTDAKYPDKLKARIAVNIAKRAGKITPSSTCEQCGNTTRTEAHHNDYTKPLKVVWLCPPCHSIAHKISLKAV